jgi:hypothetical protein
MSEQKEKEVFEISPSEYVEHCYYNSTCALEQYEDLLKSGFKFLGDCGDDRERFSAPISGFQRSSSHENCCMTEEKLNHLRGRIIESFDRNEGSYGMGGCGFLTFNLNKLPTDALALKLVVAVWCADGKVGINNVIFKEVMPILPWIIEDICYNNKENVLQFILRDRSNVKLTMELLKNSTRYDNKAIFIPKPDVPILNFYRLAHTESVLWH